MMNHQKKSQKIKAFPVRVNPLNVDLKSTTATAFNVCYQCK